MFARGDLCDYDRLSIRHSRGAFTMVEMVIVVAIILIIVGLAAPAATTMWAQRKKAQTQNAIQGLLLTARARALQADGVESGFLAYLDDRGNQHLAPIEKATFTGLDVLAPIPWQDVFVFRDEPDQVLPAPVRAVPRYVVEGAPTAANQSYLGFSTEELINNDFTTAVEDQAQRHRNFFTVVFSTDGELLVGRNVLIQDENSNPTEDQLGDHTGLYVTNTPQYYARRTSAPVPVNPTQNGNLVLPPDLLADPNDNVALNFSSVDGLLVYDESSFAALLDGEKRTFLSATGQPMYVSRYTGALVRGPIGETPTP